MQPTDDLGNTIFCQDLSPDPFPPFPTIVNGATRSPAENYMVSALGLERYPNTEGIGINATFPVFTLPGGNQSYHFHDKRDGYEAVVVNAPATDVPQLEYRSFFYDACYSGRNFGESFAHGMFIYSETGTASQFAVKDYVEGIVNGDSWTNIKTELNKLPVLTTREAYGNPYNLHQFP